MTFDKNNSIQPYGIERENNNPSCQSPLLAR